MMKRIIISISLISLVFIMLFPAPVQAKRLRDYKNEVAKLQNQQAENNRLTQNTKNSIDAKRNVSKTLYPHPNNLHSSFCKWVVGR